MKNKTKIISVFGSSFNKKEKKALNDVIDSQWVGFGNVVETFENKFKKFKNIENFLMIDSCSNGLYLAFKLLNLPKNSEVILPSFTYVSCAQAILLNNLKPVFCDVDYKTMCMTKKLVEEKITKKTSAILVVHYAGLSVDVQSIKEFKLPVVEDCAHSVNTEGTGYYGDISVWSFDSVKNLAVGEGGGIYIKDDDLFERAKKCRYSGIGKSGFSSINNTDKWWEYDISEVNIKMMPTNISAAIGIEQLKKLQNNQKIRKKIWKEYNNKLKNVGDLELPVYDDNHSFFTYAIKTNKRNELSKYLLSKNIYTTLRYHPLHLNKIYKTSYILENTEILNNTCLSLPIHPRISKKDLQYIIKTIQKFYE